ncbi:MAG: riboflavin biosynthesis protein RibD [Ignavibacteriales bacterium CG_4_9_14_3_um_filter_30_11]|nr:MAG: riboflavin biosynthesis protein RibD [Ignavibacteriales bacterium CG_4_9_14_3_um_filter_30_11]
MSITDQKYMKQCIKIAKLGAGNVSPNPLVGAVIVNNNKIISKAYHSNYGYLHAEAKAIEQVSFEYLKGSTLYCNLEPCCHTNKNTPPCVPKIIDSGIKKVIISNIDPNKFVAGKGIKQLRDSRIEVKLGECETEGYELNKFYFKFIKTGLPFITIKIAHSLDLKISSKKGQKTNITGYKSNKFVHYLRSIHDAVLVGANTIKIDNPKLTVRLVKGRNPKKIIIDGNLSSPLNSFVFNDSNKELTILFTKSNSDIKKISQLRSNGIKVYELESDDTGSLKLLDILKILANEKINSLLIEGGGIIFKMFIKENLFDEIIFLESPTIFGDGLPLNINKKSLNIKIIEEKMLGNDKKIICSNAD